MSQNIRKKKSITKNNKILDSKDIDYVIYARKSSEESTGKQVQSIFDQIRICLKFAENNDIKIKQKDLLYDVFNKIDENDLIKLKKRNVNITNDDILLKEKIKNLFVIQESKSAKVPGLRKKWTELINLVKKGKIKGILSYSPDRQSRNLLEGGELVNLVDDFLVDLKYTNFHFENTPSGKMMLGVWFVFSKQYSDKISEDAGRGSHSAFEKGGGLGIYKHGYIYDKEIGLHLIHPVNFDLMQEAFKMKIYDKESDKNIVDYLNNNGYLREYQNGKTGKMTKSTLNEIWLDPFYYGILLYGGQEKDLREINKHYIPLITEEEYNELLYRSNFNSEDKEKTNYNVSSEIDNFMAIPNSIIFVDNENNDNMNCAIKNKSRIIKRLEKLKKETGNSSLILSDIIKINDIYYISSIVEIKYLKIEEKIIEILKLMKISDEDYQISLSIFKRNLEDMNLGKDDKKKSLNIQIKKLEKIELDLIVNNTSRKRDEKEELIYQNEKNKIRKMIKERKRGIRVYG